MANVSMSTAINASVDAVWQTISDFNTAPQYIAAVANSVMEGSGVGAVRTLTLQDRAQVVERLESLDHQARTLSYRIVNAPLPLANYVSTMQVQDLGGGRCELRWSSIFEPQGVTEVEATKLVEGIYAMGFDGLKRLHEG